MAHIAAPGSQTHLGQQHAPPHGKKRAAESTLENEQRLSKRFDLLNLIDANGTRLYIPVPGSTDSTQARPADAVPVPTPHPLAFTKRPRAPRPPRPSTSDGMQVDESPNRVYIHDLAAELSDIESDEENPIFLSDIEKHLAKIPKHVLLGPEPKATEHNQVVLYNVPSSLSVPEERDGVRKAIVEARRRIRDGMGSGVVEHEGSNEGGNDVMRASQVVEEDGDAMDLD